MPESFLQFFVHEAHYSCLHRLWKDEGIDSLDVHGASWPAQFSKDVRSTLERLTMRHQLLIDVTHLKR